MTNKLLAAVCVAGLGAGPGEGTARGQYLTPGYPQPGFPQQGSGGGYGYGSSPFPNNGYGAGSYSNTAPYGPNVYNRSQQPLSPYLNLNRGSNPATNYYYGVRPGTVGGGGGGTGGSANVAPGGSRTQFFPQQADPLADPEQPGAVLPPAGHPVVFNNTLGYFPGGFGNGRGTRPGLLGAGNQAGRAAAPRR